MISNTPIPFPMCDCGHLSPDHKQSGCAGCRACDCPSFRDCGADGPPARHVATMYQHLRCTNDGNGNPRRVFVFYDASGGIVAVEDEGYKGTPAACRGLVQLPTIETYPAERRELLRTFPTLKQAQEAK